MSVRISQKTILSFESNHLRISRFSYMVVSFVKEKHQKKFFWKILFHTGFIACWNCAGTQPFVANCSQKEIWKEFSSEAQTCTLIYNVCLKDDQKNEKLKYTQVCGSQGFARTHAPKTRKNNNCWIL